MSQENTQPINFFPLVKSFYDLRREEPKLSNYKKKALDSLLAFTSYLTKDLTYYPHWARIGFDGCDYFLMEYISYYDYVCYVDYGWFNGRMLEDYEDSPQYQLYKIIMSNKDRVWNFLNQFPVFEYEWSEDKLNIRNDITRVVDLFMINTMPQLFLNKSMFKLMDCDGFLKYIKKIWGALESENVKRFEYWTSDMADFVGGFKPENKEVFLENLVESVKKANSISLSNMPRPTGIPPDWTPDYCK